jgi:acyl-[acyl-carrier-protein]-phospholipid O-acyltransferase/long-chain-fatty-acid--[acyl-carrier-protein] ligase
LSRAKLLGAAAALSCFLRKEFSDPRIAIVLPAGKGSMVANLAVALAGKVAVDLNFTAGRGANQSASKHADLRVAISATPFIERLKDFPWPQRVLKLDELMPQLKSRILFWWMMSIFAPTRLLLRLLQVPKHGGHDEAVLLFTSGTSGEPKGVVLSHRNIVGTCPNFASCSMRRRGCDSRVAAIFHSFGSTVTLWYPLIEGVRIVTYQIRSKWRRMRR